MLKTSIRYSAPNSQPSDFESPPLTIRPGLPLIRSTILTLHRRGIECLLRSQDGAAAAAAAANQFSNLASFKS